MLAAAGIGIDANREWLIPAHVLGVIATAADCPPDAKVIAPGTAGSAQWKSDQAMVIRGGRRPGAKLTVWVAVNGLSSIVVYGPVVAAADGVAVAVKVAAVVQRCAALAGSSTTE